MRCCTALLRVLQSGIGSATSEPSRPRCFVCPDAVIYTSDGTRSPLFSEARHFIRKSSIPHPQKKKQGFSSVGSRLEKETRRSSRAGSGGVRNLTGRVGSYQEVFKHHGSGRVTLTRPDPRGVIRSVRSPVFFSCKLTAPTRWPNPMIWPKHKKVSQCVNKEWHADVFWGVEKKPRYIYIYFFF